VQQLVVLSLLVLLRSTVKQPACDRTSPAGDIEFPRRTAFGRRHPVWYLHRLNVAYCPRVLTEPLVRCTCHHPASELVVKSRYRARLLMP
jgi:hypothetical protein